MPRLPQIWVTVLLVPNLQHGWCFTMLNLEALWVLPLIDNECVAEIQIRVKRGEKEKAQTSQQFT